MNRSCFRAIFLLVLISSFAIIPINSFSETMKIITNEGFATVSKIFTNKCLECHSWPGSYKETVDPSRIVPFHPELSKIYLNVEDDTMPMSTDKLTPDEKNLIKAWIASGATDSVTPITGSVTDSGTDASVGDAQKTEPGKKLPGSVTLHAVTGFTSAGLFYAAGIVSTIHFLNIMNEGHALEEQGIATEANRGTYMMSIWNEPANQALRWWHVGLLSGGEVLYLYNAVTGIGMWSKDQPGVTREKLHRFGFFLHGGLMIAQIILGVAETYALSTGNHDIHVGIGAAHCIIGFAIPTVMVIAGVENIIR
jgi:hypothetical protein